jgi:prepilin-type N-terminal cleavage/methylation domain-containing protein/prepilin-type processing-associated H-X9-DG protein
MQIHQTNKKPTKTTKGAFTFIELLVVIAIIAILAAILFPVFGRVRENARRTSCQSNLKQLALGIFQYTGDYDERYPIRDGAPTSTGSTGRWPRDVFPYVKSIQVFQCPSKRTNPDKGNIELETFSQYGMPYASGNNNTEVLSRLGYPTVLVQEPTRSFLLTETKQANSTNGSGFWTPSFTRNSTANSAEHSTAYFTSSVHLEGYNVAFADGHVKWVKFGDSNSYIWRCPSLPNQAYTAQGTGNGQCPGAT